MKRTFQKIPQHQVDEFLNQQTFLIKSRLKLATILFAFCVFAGDIIGVLSLQEKVNFQMKVTWALAVALCVVINLLVKKISKFQLAKISAALFMIAVLAILAKDNIVYHTPPFDAAMIFIFCFFGASLIFPWFAHETVFVSLSHFGAFTIFLFNSPQYSYRGTMVTSELPDYLEGYVIMFLASIVCFVVSRRERERDIENFVLLKEIEGKNKQMQNELELATRVHSRLIPRSASTPLADIAVTYVPMYYMGGDYAKFHFIDNNKLIFIICDVTGHGVSAALLVNTINIEFERLAKKGKKPGDLLKELDRFITNDFAEINMYLTAFCGLLDYGTFSRKFTYSSYGHLPQYVYRTHNSKIEKIPAQTSFLGLPMEDENVYENEIPFKKEDRILLFTDGVTEAKNAEGIEYGDVGLEKFINKNSNLEVELFNQKLLDELNTFTNKRMKDDIFILNIKTK